MKNLLSWALAFAGATTAFGCTTGEADQDCIDAKCDSIDDGDQNVTGAAKEHRDRIRAQMDTVSDACIASGDAIRGAGAVDALDTVSGDKLSEQISGTLPENFVFANDGAIRPTQAGVEYTMNGQTLDIRASKISSMIRGYYGPQMSGATVAFVYEWDPSSPGWLEVGFHSGSSWDAESTSLFTDPPACDGEEPVMPCIGLKRTGTQPTDEPTLVFLDAPEGAKELFIKVGDDSGSQTTTAKIYDIQVEAHGVAQACNPAIVAEERFDGEARALEADEMGPGKLAEQDPDATVADGWFPFHSVAPQDVGNLVLETGLGVRKLAGAQEIQIARLHSPGFGIAKPDMGFDLSGGRMHLTFAKEEGIHIWVVADDAAAASTEPAVDLSSLPHCTDNGNSAPCIVWDLDRGKHTVVEGRLLSETKELPLPDGTTGTRFVITRGTGGNAARFRVSDMRFYAD